MKFTSAITLTLGTAAGFAGAKQLLERETLPPQVPPALRPPLLEVRARLLLLRARVEIALAEMEAGRREAEAELMAEYYDRSARASATAVSVDTHPDPRLRRYGRS